MGLGVFERGLIFDKELEKDLRGLIEQIKIRPRLRKSDLGS